VLIVTFEPGENLLWAVGRHEHLEPPLRHPLRDEGPKQVGLQAAVGALATRPGSSGLGVDTATADGEPQTAQDASGLMGGEVRSIQPSDEADDLLRWIATPIHNDVVIREGFGQRASRDPADLGGFELEAVVSNRCLYL